MRKHAVIPVDTVARGVVELAREVAYHLLRRINPNGELPRALPTAREATDAFHFEMQLLKLQIILVMTLKLNCHHQKHPVFLSARFSCTPNSHKFNFFNRKAETKREPGRLSAAPVVQAVSGGCVTQEWPFFPPPYAFMQSKRD